MTDSSVVPMAGHEFVAMVRERTAIREQVQFTRHAEEQILRRRLTFARVINALRKGELVRGPRWDARYGSFSGRIDYRGSGELVRVACAIARLTPRVLVITAMGSEGGDDDDPA